MLTIYYVLHTTCSNSQFPQEEWQVVPCVPYPRVSQQHHLFGQPRVPVRYEEQGEHRQSGQVQPEHADTTGEGGHS